MTRISNDNQPVQRHPKAMPQWLVFVISVLALGVPVAGLLFMLWLAVVRPAGFDITPVELAYIAIATILIAAVMASYAHRKQRPLP
ncbi:hypothetical protein MKL09_01010 [Methylobacterium sp. J-048]|uniref:hypothetical protein n=1 Tax=unclassified Methylobacterium TaxID=2615210 RepID=UPI001FBB885A|nr:MULTISPECIES: hypothetical protein [unclassified Methylobacterium]MCJ2055130.1 hypothetical protein [Methylobacterium sp. J-048]MCJ2141516.1 hypothetical protein [Methylobacterium sp. E-066]